MKRGMTPLMTTVRRVAIVEDHGALRIFLGSGEHRAEQFERLVLQG